MGKFIDMTGVVCGRLTPLRYVGDRFWDCKCSCGRTKVIAGVNLRNGRTKSCGCFAKESVVKRRKDNPLWGYKHGQTDSKTYESWSSMRKRCLNPNHPSYSGYGGRGISICKRWDNFERFLDDMGERPAERSLDRINNDGNYEPENCRWATAEEQRNNTRKTVKLTFHGVTRTLTAWARALDMPVCTLHARIKRGWPIGRALTEKVRRRNV